MQPGLNRPTRCSPLAAASLPTRNLRAKYRLALYEAKAGLIDDVNDELESAILTQLANAEAAGIKDRSASVHCTGNYQ